MVKTLTRRENIEAFVRKQGQFNTIELPSSLLLSVLPRFLSLSPACVRASGGLSGTYYSSPGKAGISGLHSRLPRPWDSPGKNTGVFIPGLGRSLAGGHGNPLQYSCLGNPMDRGAWQAMVHGVAKSQTRLSDFTFTFHASGPSCST